VRYFRFYHDSAAALLVDGKIVAAAQEERFIRKKHTPDFSLNAVNYCLEYSGCRIDELDAVVFKEIAL
jgi:carbamoyltransferase